MRINKEKFPILDILRMSKEEFSEKRPLKYGGNITNTVAKDDWTPVEQFINANFEALGQILNNGNVDMVSYTFMDNVLKNTHLYKKISINDILDEINPSGIIMINMAEVATLIYNWDKTSNFTFIVVTGGNVVRTLIWENGEEGVTYGDSYMEVDGKYVSKEKDSLFFYSLMHYILLFKHYAKVETIHVKPKEKVRDPNSKEKHFNETDIPINILDCRWFNNIIRDEPFGVRGHFRLQPKKDKEGKWIKEMIYIKPFIKTGYNIKAKKKPDNK